MQPRTILSVLLLLVVAGGRPASAVAQSSPSRALASVPWSGVYVQIEEREKRFIGAYGGRVEHLRYRVELSAPVSSQTHQATLFRAGRFASALVAGAFVGHDSSPTLSETFAAMGEQAGACKRMCDRTGESASCDSETFMRFAVDQGSVRRRIDEQRTIAAAAAQRLDQGLDDHRVCVANAATAELRVQTELATLATAAAEARARAQAGPTDPALGQAATEAEARATAAQPRLVAAAATKRAAEMTCGDALVPFLEPLLRFVSPNSALLKERVCDLANPSARLDPDGPAILVQCVGEPISASSARIVRDAALRLFEESDADLLECRAIAHSTWVRDHHDVVSRAVGERGGMRWMLGGQAAVEYARVAAYSAGDVGGESSDFDQLRVDLGPSMFLFQAHSEVAWYLAARAGLRVAQQPEVDEAERCTALPSTTMGVTGRVCEDVSVYAEAPSVAASLFSAFAFGLLFPAGLDGSRPGLELRTSFDDVGQRAVFRWGLNAFISPRIVDGGSSDFMNPLIVRFGLGFEASQALYDRNPIAGTQSPTIRPGDLVDFRVLGLAGVSI